MYNGYDYSTYSSSTGSTAVTALGAGVVLGIWIVSLIISIILLVAIAKIFKKANKPGWAAIIPIYNIIVMLEIAGLPLWYLILFCIPFANIYAMFKLYIELAKKFGKGAGFGVLMIFFPIIAIPYLGFSKCQYVGATQTATEAPAEELTPDVVATPELSSQPLNQSMNVETQTVEPEQPAEENPSDAVEPQAPTDATPANVKVCASCGSQIDVNNVNCPVCGSQQN